MMTMPRRICVKGTSCAGKSTFAAELARRLDVTFVELDALFHGPNWSEPTAEAFRASVRAAMAAATGGWVIDGNYDSKLGDTVVDAADTIVWLDLPLSVKLGRLCGRTLHRIRGEVELWHGNRETWRGAVFGRDSLFFWTIQRHFRHRRQWPDKFGNDPRFVRLRSEEEASAWLNEQASAISLAGR
ncbi:MAG: adenylate kinase [Thermomicrobiales bacterium]